MRLLLIALVSSILLLGACLDKKPKGILSEKKMTALLTEVHLLDGYLLTLQIDSAKKVMDTLYVQVLSKYKLDSASFSKNVDYYYANPIKTEKMYEKVYKNLDIYQQELDRQDSIRYAFERDSLNRASRYQTLLDFQQKLWRFYPDTTYRFDRNEYIRRLYLPTGLLYIWQHTNVSMPPRPQRQPSQPTPEVTRRSVGDSPIRRDPDLVEDRPMLEDVEENTN